MKPLSKDARNFVEGVTRYIRRGKHGKDVLPRVQSLFTKVTGAAKKERTASVTSVIVLSENEKLNIKHIVGNLVGHDIDCQFRLDPVLLGGMKIQIADWIVDTSLSSQLTNMARTLL